MTPAGKMQAAIPITKIEIGGSTPKSSPSFHNAGRFTRFFAHRGISLLPAPEHAASEPDRQIAAHALVEGAAPELAIV